MLNQKVYEGYWWLPDNPDNKLHGTINLEDEQNITISILGSLSGHTKGCKAITGISIEGKHITLLDCSFLQDTRNHPGIQQCFYRARVIFIGIILESFQPLLLNRLSFRFTNLEYWVGRSGFITGRGSNPFDIQYCPPKSLELTLPNDYKLTIDSKPVGKFNLKEIYLIEKDWITIEPPEEEDIDTLLKVVDHLQDFFSLVIGGPVCLTQIEGCSKLATRNIDIALSKIKQPKTQKYPFPLLPLYEIEDELELILKKWFNVKNVIEPAINLYFGTLYEEKMNLQRDFLFLAQAVETYHRRTSEEKEYSEEEHNHRLQEILESVPEKYQDWLEGKLKYSNELNLRKRLKKIIDQFTNIFGDYIHRREFTNKVVNTRNYLTHYDPELEDSAISEVPDLLELIYKLRTILETCFLNELNLDDEKISRVIKRKIEDRIEMIKLNR